MPASLQAKLLRTLQDSHVQPLGAQAPIPVNVRVLAATHRDLEAMCATGQFQDLYYRLNVIPLTIPPLRERPEDVIPLVRHLLARIGHRQAERTSRSAVKRRSWSARGRGPVTYAELENAIERAIVFSSKRGDRPGAVSPKRPH